MTMDDITHVLLDNRIPVLWVDHAYTFGLHYLNHHLGHTTAAQSTLEAVDNMHIVNLSIWGVPPAISEWDEWHTVVEHDMLRLYQVLENEEHRDIYCTDNSPAWLCVGRTHNLSKCAPVIKRQTLKSITAHHHHHRQPHLRGVETRPCTTEQWRTRRWQTIPVGHHQVMAALTHLRRGRHNPHQHDHHQTRMAFHTFFVNFFFSPYLYMGFRHKHHIFMIIMLYTARL
jgi:hypothetical protein